MNKFYRVFRSVGLNATQAFTAAFCAVRVRRFEGHEVQSWTYLFRNRTDEQCRDCKAAISSVLPVR